MTMMFGQGFDSPQLHLLKASDFQGLFVLVISGLIYPIIGTPMCT